MVMKSTGIADLKAHLSEYLRAVRRGQEVTVLDRDTPIAKIVAIERRSRLAIRRRSAGAPLPGKLDFPASLKLSIDPLDLLIEDRRKR